MKRPKKLQKGRKRAKTDQKRVFPRVNLGTDFDGFPRVHTELMSLLWVHFGIHCILTTINHLHMYYYIEYKRLKCLLYLNLEIQSR